MSQEKNMLDALAIHQAFAYRSTTAIVNELNNRFGSDSNKFASALRELLDDLSDAEKNAFTLGKYTTPRLKEIRSLFDDWYESIAIVMPELFATSIIAYADYETKFASNLYGKEIEPIGEKAWNLAKKKPIVGGELFDEVWKNLADSTKKKALYAVRQGINEGKTTADIVKELKGYDRQVAGDTVHVDGIVDKTKAHIEADVRTVRSHVANVAYDMTFDALGFEYRKDVATLDGRTSFICASRDGRVQKVGAGFQYAPYHFNCRTMQIGCDADGKIDGLRPFVADNRSVKDIPMGERDGVIGQVSANTKYPTWFARQDASFQRDWLGDTRYELYKKGGYKIEKFVDPLGGQYTIAELKALDEKTFKRLGL